MSKPLMVDLTKKEYSWQMFFRLWIMNLTGEYSNRNINKKILPNLLLLYENTAYSNIAKHSVCSVLYNPHLVIVDFEFHARVYDLVVIIVDKKFIDLVESMF